MSSSLVVPGAVLRPVRNTARDQMQQRLGLILHVQQGNNSPFGRFDDPATEVSSTWWVSKTGVIEQYVDDPSIRMWAQGDGNEEYASVETEGFTNEPLTDAQLKGVAHIYLFGNVHYKWEFRITNVPGSKGLGTHEMGGAAWGGHPCPGSIRSAQRDDILALANPAHPFREGFAWWEGHGYYRTSNIPENATGVEGYIYVRNRGWVRDN